MLTKELEGLTLQIDSNKNGTIEATEYVRGKTKRYGGTYSKRIKCNIV
jgi:hypothetical protein